MEHRVFTIWLTGLTASGKTTLGSRLEADLKDKGHGNIIFLDGEAFREQLKNYRYATYDRNDIGIQKAMYARDLNRKGKSVITTGIAHHRDTRQKIRNIFDYYYEVYLKCSAKHCADRDFKGHYKKAFAGEYENFIGVTEDYEESTPELILDTQNESIDECSQKLLNFTLDILKESRVEENV